MQVLFVCVLCDQKRLSVCVCALKSKDTLAVFPKARKPRKPQSPPVQEV